MATMILPGLLLGLASCWHCDILKTFLAHPSIILMPVFTHFTFAYSSNWCKGSPTGKRRERDEEKEEGEKQEKAGGAEKEPFVVFSTRCTLLNLILSTCGCVVYGLSMTQILGNAPYLRVYLSLYLYISVPASILGLLLTLALTSTCSTH